MKNFRISGTFIFTGLLVFCFMNLSAQTAKNNPVKTPASQNAIQQKFSVYFDVNQSRIKPEDYKVLDSVITILKKGVNIRRIQINGYADTTGGADANLELSNRRTDTVANYILGNGLTALKSKVSTASLGEKISGKEADLNEMRRVDVVLFMARPDRDTILRMGCISVHVKANTFDGFNNDEVQFKIEYTGTPEEVKKMKMGFKDDEGNALLSNGVIKIVATYRGKAVKALQAVTVNLPRINSESDYLVYKGIEDKNKNISSWKKTEIPVRISAKQSGAAGEDCDVQTFETKDLNTTLAVEKKWPACYCSSDPFGGVQTPVKSNPMAKFGKDGSIIQINESCFKKVDANTAWVGVEDNLYPDEFLNFCNGFLLPGVGNVPQIPKFDREIIKFIDLNVSQKNDTADQIMIKKSKILLMIPKSKFPAHNGKQYAILPAETKKDNYLDWTNKIVFNDACQGLVNCDYWVFEVPFTGFYTLLELTPLEKDSKGKSVKSEDDEESAAPAKNVKIKTKKFNNVMIVYGKQEENKTSTSKFIKNKGKHSFNEPALSKAQKKEFADHVFMAYVVVDGKRYAWIGKGRDLKTNFLTGNWKTPKLQYVPDDEWENFVKKACE
jgi:hypothetical protein